MKRIKDKPRAIFITVGVILILLTTIVSGNQSLPRLFTDINKDGTINYADLEIIAEAFGAEEGKERYNPVADLNEDMRIDILDLCAVAKTFGESYYGLIINIIGQGTTNPVPGIHGYYGGTQINITALPDPGWNFSHWSGEVNGSQNPITITVNSDKNITAHFTKITQIIYKLHGLDFGPYVKEGQNPKKGTVISKEQIRELMTIIRPYTEWVRTFGCTNGLEVAGRVAHELGLKIAVGAWLDKNFTSNEEQITNLITIGQSGEAEILIVGSEVLLRSDFGQAQLIGYINRVREAVPGIPVTYEDVYGELLQHKAVMEACDIIMVNNYPAWEEVSINYAIYHLHLRHQQVVEATAGKQVIIGETGWPSEGYPHGEAIPSLENACFHFLNFVSWARAENVSYFYFEAFDEPWKSEHSWGPHWGVWFSNGTLKPGMERVFNNETIPNNWGSEIIDGPGNPTIEFTYVPPYGNWSYGTVKGQVRHIKPVDYQVAVYIKVRNGWWTKPYYNNPSTIILPDGTWDCDITTGGIDHRATDIAAFLVPFNYTPPLKSGGSTHPSELYDNATTYVEVTRAVELRIGIIGQGTTDPAPEYSGFPPETIVTITAIPAQNWQFDHWSGDINGTQNPVDVIMNSYKDIVAVFVIMPGYHELAIKRQGKGSIDPELGSHTYPEGTAVTITATPDQGWRFECWLGDVEESQNPIIVVMDTDKEVIARFVSTES